PPATLEATAAPLFPSPLEGEGGSGRRAETDEGCQPLPIPSASTLPPISAHPSPPTQSERRALLAATPSPSPLVGEGAPKGRMRGALSVLALLALLLFPTITSAQSPSAQSATVTSKPITRFQRVNIGEPLGPLIFKGGLDLASP